MKVTKEQRVEIWKDREEICCSHNSGIRHSGVLQKKITADNCIDQKATRKDFKCFHHNKWMNIFKFPFFEDIKK